MGTFAEKLRAMRETWRESSAVYDSTFGGVKVDPGQYTARLQSAKIVESKTSGNLMIRREHVILDGQFKGSIVRDNMNLSNAMGMSFVRHWIDQMGYEPPDDPEGIEEVLDVICSDAPLCKIAVKQSGDFVNVSVIEVYPNDDLPQSSRPSQSSQQSRTSQSSQERQTSGKNEDAEDDSESNPIRDRLFAFCKAQDIDTEPDDSIDVLRERIREYQFPEDELTEEEKQLFADAGIEDVIERKPPKAKKKN